MKSIFFFFGVISVAIITSGCTIKSVRVNPLNTNAHHIKMICIQKNDKVVVDEFLPIVQSAFRRHNINTKVYSGSVPASCKYKLSYVAHGKWDLYLYLSSASMEIIQNNEIIASVVYNGPTGLNPLKRTSSESKINPLVDALLAKQTKTKN